MKSRQPQDTVEALRQFNRFYTQHIGALNEGLLDSDYSLTEARVLWELAHEPGATAGQICDRLSLDAGYLSRLLLRLSKAGLLRRSQSPHDGRKYALHLTATGRKAFTKLNQRSREQVQAQLRHLSNAQQTQLTQAAQQLHQLLLPSSADSRGKVILREHRAGDIGWVVHRQAVLYAAEYGWNNEFEALVAEIGAKFIRHFKPGRERCWVAERDGQILGAVFMVERSKTVAQLRMLYVEPEARGLGIGRQLVSECTRFAQSCGYRKIMLWTNSILDAARHLYQREGYTLVKEESHHSFGHKLTGQHWQLLL